MIDLNEREKLMLHMVLSYAYANYDDLIDAFSDSSDEDGKILIAGKRAVPLTDEELEVLAKKITGIDING